MTAALLPATMIWRVAFSILRFIRLSPTFRLEAMIRLLARIVTLLSTVPWCLLKVGVPIVVEPKALWTPPMISVDRVLFLMLLVMTISGPLVRTIPLSSGSNLPRVVIPFRISRTSGLLRIVLTCLGLAMKHGETQFPLNRTFLAKLKDSVAAAVLLMATILLPFIPLKVLVTSRFTLVLRVETAVIRVALRAFLIGSVVLERHREIRVMVVLTFCPMFTGEVLVIMS